MKKKSPFYIFLGVIFYQKQKKINLNYKNHKNVIDTSSTTKL